MARSLTATQMKELMDLKRGYMNDWEVNDVEVSYDTAGKLADNYDDEFNEIYMNKSTRMLIQALEALEATGGLDFAVLKHPELGGVWGRYTQRREEKRRRAEALKKLKATFSKEEMQLLGISSLAK